jgi:hypothetical protein
MTKYPDRFTERELHQAWNLRAISADVNPELHLSRIRKDWNTFHRANPSATRQGILENATGLDDLYGSLFLPPR